MRRWVSAAAMGLAVVCADAAGAAECDPGKAPGDLSGDEVKAVYDCISENLRQGYASGDEEWDGAAMVRGYRDWTLVSSLPAAPGFHGGRFLLTWVNDVGDEAYMRYAEDPDIPVGTEIAKESFQISDEGTVSPGPLFLMRKVPVEQSADTMGWHYMMVSPDGQPQGINPWTACNECHVGNYAHQGGLGYPVEEVRIRR